MEKYISSIFGVGVCRLRKWVGYIGMLQWWWPPKHKECKEMKPVIDPAQWKSWIESSLFKGHIKSFITGVGNGIVRTAGLLRTPVSYPHREEIETLNL
jgi:hypothetical protein